MTRSFWAFIIFILAFGSACGSEPTPTSTATTTPRPTTTPSGTPEPSPTAKASETPTPGPLTPEELFSQVSPSVVFIETAVGSGSGVFMEGGYVLTNAHVVWPFDRVRVVFPDGTELEEAPVVGWDLMVDLALVGPVEAEAGQLALSDGEGLATGSEVYLIGYPGEVEEFPQPTITRGILSRTREWQTIGLTYFQTDAAIAAGQSGGVLVSALGEVIGISGFAFTEARFGLAGSAADLVTRIDQLLAGEHPDGLGPRRLPAENGRREDTFYLDGKWDQRVYVMEGGADIEVEMNLVGNGDAFFVVVTNFGDWVTWGMTNDSDLGVATFTLERETPYFVIVEQEVQGLNEFTITSDRQLYAYEDPDDGAALERGESVSGVIDFPGDLDYYTIFLQAGEEINIKVDSVLIDPHVLVDYAVARDEDILSDDDSGGGVFDLAAELTYRAPRTSPYTIIVRDVGGYSAGGYVLTVDEPYEGAPTAVAPLPTQTPLPSPHGPMRVFDFEDASYSLQVPYNWPQRGRGECSDLACFDGPGATVLYLSRRFSGGMSLEDYAEEQVEELDEFYLGFSLLEVRELVTEDRLEARVIDFEVVSRGYVWRGSQLVFVDEEDRVAYLVTYFVIESSYAGLEPLINHSFSSFARTD